MTLCVIDGKQCQCQPDEGAYCKLACARIAAVERALSNCCLLAMKRLHKGAIEKADWEAILRFCTEAGCGPSPLRADS